MKLTEAYTQILLQDFTTTEAVSDADASEQKVDNSFSKLEELNSAIKRSLKIVLQLLKQDTILGDPLNFTTIKDKIIFKQIRDCYAAELENELTIDQVR